MLNLFVPVTLPLHRLQVQDSELAKGVRVVGRPQGTRKPSGPGLVTWILLGTGCIKIQGEGQAVVSG